jgi:hypothetical protein
MFTSYRCALAHTVAYLSLNERRIATGESGCRMDYAVIVAAMGCAEFMARSMIFLESRSGSSKCGDSGARSDVF